MDRKSARRRADRRIALAFFTGGLVLAAGIVACHPHAPAPAGDHPAPQPLVVTDARVCATVAVYALGGDAWDQRALVASTTLNRFEKLGHVPDCGSALTALVSRGIDPLRWRNALDAVDAVRSGSYAIPLACARADTVVPPTVPAGAPLFRAAARAQCVLPGLAFVETLA